ncbi:glycosyl transferase family 1 [Mucilaginibacter sp. PAMC 26640]|nr:glycosyl transferase family 1 [Mucilaginibacter sp. PAMC 26640]
MKVMLSHATGNEFVRALLLALHNNGMLAEFDTTVAANANSAWLNFLPSALKQEWLRRTYPIPQNIIRSHPTRELARLIMPRLGLSKPVRHEQGWASVDAVYRDLDSKIAHRLKGLQQGNPIDAIYAYEDGALATFKQAKNLGLQCLYDLPIGYWRAAREMLTAEAERWPDWAVTLTGLKDSDSKLARKDEELKLADKIFVASSFTAKTLDYFPGQLAKIQVIPYAFPAVAQGRIYQSAGKTGPLKILFVGGLSQRKGIADLFEAVEDFGKRVSLTVVGRKMAVDCAVLNEALARHKWIPSLAHAEVLKLMRESDVLIFPSLFEGFGLVITEAMAQGTPVITTERTAGPDIITDGEDGWLIEAGAADQLKAAIERILSNPALIKKTGTAAMAAARKRPWAKYGQELVEGINN